jgi:hypothetical protein
MRGKCSFSECSVGDDEALSMAECSSCSKPVHHMCSNAVYESELTVRVCSTNCASALGLGIQPARSSAVSLTQGDAVGSAQPAPRNTKAGVNGKTSGKRKRSVKLKKRSSTTAESGNKYKARKQTVSGHNQLEEARGGVPQEDKHKHKAKSGTSYAKTRIAATESTSRVASSNSMVRNGMDGRVTSGSLDRATSDISSSSEDLRRQCVDSSDDDMVPVDEQQNRKSKKFYFTPADDLALLREILSVQPYAAKHGSITSRYQEVTDNLNEHLQTDLSVRTVKEHFFLLVKEFKATDCEYRKKSGVAEEYTEHKRLLQDIADGMRDLEANKRKQKEAVQAKTDRLVTAGARLREQAVLRRCQWRKSSTDENGESDTSDTSALESLTTAQEVDDTMASATAPESLPGVGVTTAQVNRATVSFIAGQHQRHNEEFELLREELNFKMQKAERENARWKAEMEFRQQEADQKNKRASEDAALRRAELALRREELAVLKHQLGIQRLPNGGDGAFV